MNKVNRGTRAGLVRWPLIEEREWRVTEDVEFLEGLQYAFRYVQGTRLVVINSGAGVVAGLMALDFPTARVFANDVDRHAPSTFQMADRNRLENVDFARKFGIHDVGVENYFDCALLCDVLSSGARDRGLVGGAARAVRPGGRVLILVREPGGEAAAEALSEDEMARRLGQAGLALSHRARVPGFAFFVGVKEWRMRAVS